MKNVKRIWRLSGWFLMAVLFLGGSTLRAQNKYTLVTNASTLEAGDEVLIECPYNGFFYAMSAATGNTGTDNEFRPAAQVTVKDNTITNPDIATSAGEQKACVFTLEKNAEGKYAFKDKVNNNYIATNVKIALPSTAEACWFSVSFRDGGKADIYESNHGRYVRYQNGFKAWSDYYDEKEEVYIYKKEAPKGPYIQTDETEVNYKITPETNLDVALVFRAGKLTDDVSVEVASADEGRTNAVIRVNRDGIDQDDAEGGFDLTLTTKNLTVGEYTDIITVTSGEAQVKVTVHLTVKVADIYQLVTDIASLEDDDEVLMVADDGKGGYRAMGALTALVGSAGRIGVAITVTNNTIVGPEIATEKNDEENAFEFTIKTSDVTGVKKYGFKDVVAGRYITTNGAHLDNVANTSPYYFFMEIDANTGVIDVATSNSSLSTARLRYSSDAGEFKMLAPGSANNAVYLYKKQEPEGPACAQVTLPDDGVTTTDNSVEFSWDAPDDAPENGYSITVTGTDYNQTKVANKEATQVEFTDLASETTYNYSIVSMCGEGLESKPVEGTFFTDPAGNPEVKITNPVRYDTTVVGDVIITFTLEDFTLDDSHLVKAEVKAKKQTTAGQAAAPVLKTVYTKTPSLTISGLADGKYHVDLYMVIVSGKDTAVVGFNGKDYVHRDIEVKHPAVYFSPNPLKITTYRGTSASGEVTVTGWALPAGSSVNFTSSDNKFTITPSNLTQAQVMATGGAKITVAYNGAAANATATITASCGANISSSFTVNGMARDTLANLKGLYSRANNDTVLMRGKMVVTHKDTSNNRVWVQDINKENGASMLLYQVTVAKGYADLKVGDVLGNFAGRVTISNGLYRFTPLAKVTALEHNHAVYVDTLTADDINNRFAQVQSALACVKNVTFAETGNFAKNTKYTLKQGNKNINFVAFNSADYVGKPIPTIRLYVVGVITKNTTYGNYIASRKEADMTEAPCLVPTDFNAEVHSDEATIAWQGLAANYSVRYAKTEAGLASAEVKTVTNKKSFTATELDPLTPYYYQVKSLCSATAESGWSAVQTFTTRSATEPSINMNSPVDFPTFTDSVKVSFRLKNVTLAAGDITARIVFSDGFTVDNYTDTVYKRAMPSGDYHVQVILMKDNDTLNPSVQTRVRYFSVDLPDVAKPTFAPRAGRYRDSVEVTLNCTTPGASIFYAKGTDDYVAYAPGSKILLKESATFKAFACKHLMDTSEVATAAYTVYSNITPEGDLVFAENFNKSTKASTTVISTFANFTDMSGWSGANMYPEVGEIKGGTSSKAGKLVSREIDLSYNNGKYYVAFFARAYNNKADSTKIRLTAGGESVLVNGLDKMEMTEYVYVFNNGTAHTRLTFEALAADYNRFYLDSIRVYQELPPMIIAPATLSMRTVQGTPVSRTVTVRGKSLEQNVTVTCPEGNFSVSETSLPKADVMSEEGVVITVTFNGNVPSDSVDLSLVSGSLSHTIKVTAAADLEPDAEITVVATLTMNTVQGTPVSKKVSVKGKYLKDDVSVTCPEGNFSVSPASLDKEAVMSEEGAEFTVTFNGAVLSDNVEITLASGDLTKTIAVTAKASNGDECEAPTLLSAAVLDKNVTLSWNSEAQKCHVVVTLGEKEVCNEVISEILYELKNLEEGVYAWKVASVCEAVEQWTDGDNFEVKELANESAEGLAFRIYPNPTVGAFYVEVAESARMEIFTVGGVMIRNAELTEGKHEIRLDRSGIYFVRLTGAHGAAVNRVIVR